MGPRVVETEGLVGAPPGGGPRGPAGPPGLSAPPAPPALLTRRALARLGGAAGAALVALAAPAGAGAGDEWCDVDPDPHVVRRAGRVYTVLVGYAVLKPDLPRVHLITSSVGLGAGDRLEVTVASPVRFTYTVRVQPSGYAAGPRGPYEPGVVHGWCDAWWA
jgi:hypothetical protein